MRKLTKQHKEKKAEFIKRLTDARQLLEDEITDTNAVLKAKHSEIEEKVTEFNDLKTERIGKITELQSDVNTILEEVRGWMDEVGSEIGSTFDEMSEKWQEGEKGQAHSEWRETWEDQPEDLDITLPEEDMETPPLEEIDEPDNEIIEMIDNLADEPNE